MAILARNVKIFLLIRCMKRLLYDISRSGVFISTLQYSIRLFDLNRCSESSEILWVISATPIRRLDSFRRESVLGECTTRWRKYVWVKFLVVRHKKQQAYSFWHTFGELKKCQLNTITKNHKMKLRKRNNAEYVSIWTMQTTSLVHASAAEVQRTYIENAWINGDRRIYVDEVSQCVMSANSSTLWIVSMLIQQRNESDCGTIISLLFEI